MTIKFIAILGGILLLAGGIFYDIKNQPEQIKIVKKQKEVTVYTSLPHLTMRTFEGQEISVHALQEPVILLSFMASWCSVCLAEFPDMLRLVEQMEGRVALLAVSIDNTQKDAEKFKNMVAQQQVPVDIPHVYWVWDEGKEISLKTFNVKKTPETFLINAKRQIVDKIVGKYDWASNDIKERLNSL